MNLWLDGLSALTEHAWAAFAIFLIISWGIFITRGLLFRLFSEALTEADLLSLSIAGWVMPALLLSIFTFGISLLFNAFTGGVFAVAIVFISSFMLIRKEPLPSHILILVALFVPSLILRFAFIADLVLPSYFDPAEHYRLINSMTETYHTGVLSAGFQGVYYHLGFHSLAAFISYFLHVDILDLMLAFGQIILALLPAPFFFIVKRETDSTPAAFFACLVAGFGFHMPAHLMNWGKYPALLSLITILFVINLAYMAYRDDLFNHRKSIFILLGSAVIVSILTHSRTMVLYGMLSMAAIISFVWNRLWISYRFFGIIVLIGILAIEIASIQNNPALRILLNTYLTNDSWMLILILLLTIESAIFYPKPTFFILLWLVLCILCIFIPITIPVYDTQTLLDRPFVQMFSIIPFSILGGLGFAGVTQWIKRLRPNLNLIRRFATFLLFGFVLLNAALNYKFYPSDCCRFASRDDLAAFTWMDKSLPPDATILIASTGLYVTSFETPETQNGVDAGIWIPSLLSRKVVPANQETRFDNVETHVDLCNKGIDYIYVGGMPQSFNLNQLESQPAWYSPSFILPSAKIYQVLGCKG